MVEEKLGNENGIPVIDLEDFPRESKKLLEACKEWGCFTIINHKMSVELMMEMKSVVRSLLDLPLEIRKRNQSTVISGGYIPPNEMNPLYESLGLYDPINPQAVERFCQQLEASPRQKEVIESYSRALYEVIKEILIRLAESIGLKTDFAKEWPTLLRIIKYSFSEEALSAPGLRSHTDGSFLTIIQGDECVGGLEVLSKSGEYIPFDPTPGSFIINLGDIAKAWSNGRFNNVKHRVVCKQPAIRVSIAIFLFGPPEGELVDAPPQFIDSDHPRLYAPFTYEYNRSLRISKGWHNGETIEHVRLTNSA